MTTRALRVAAYGLCLQDEQVLLARYVSPDGAVRHWTLPGGGVEHGEDPYAAVAREVTEETGYQVRVEQLLGVDSRTRRGDAEVFQTIGIFYRVAIIGGQLRHEVGGSTDLPAWTPVKEVPGLPRAVIVDVGLELYHTQPPAGYVPLAPVDGLLRH